MIEKVIKIRKLNELGPDDDLDFWLSLPPDERISAVEFLRRQFNGDSTRLQRTVKVIKRS